MRSTAIVRENVNVADGARVCTPLASVGMEEDVDAEGMHEIPERDLDPLRLCRIIGTLQARVLELEREVLGGVGNLPQETFFALTGFRDVATARKEFEKAGGHAVFGSLARHGTALDAESLKRALEIALDQMPGCGAELQAAYAAVFARRVHGDSKASQQGRKPIVDSFHLFLLPFMYVHGGMLQAWAPFLPGVGVSQSHFSRLVTVATPVVSWSWASNYYCKRGLAWLLQNARPSLDTPPLLSNAAHADIVLFIDGMSLEAEKSDTGIEQKELFDWSKDKMPLLRVLVVTTADGTIVEISEVSGGRATEVMVARSMAMIERLSAEAWQLQREVRLHFIVDRGFLDLANSVHEQRWPNLNVTIDIPHHLNPPVGRGKYVRGAPKAKKRKQHEAQEVEYNRMVAAVRWVNEVAVGALKRCRLLQHRIDLSVVHNITAFLHIAAALVNYQKAVNSV